MKFRRFVNGCIVVLSLTSLSGTPVAAELEEVAGYFEHANVVSGPELVDCTLSGGSKTSCFQIVVKPDPTNYTPGPWCPGDVNDSNEHGGIWFEGGEVHDVTGAFIENLAEFYSDSNWQLFDPDTGKIAVTDTLEKCEGAARPDVDPELQQHCVECRIEYLDDDATVTYTIPLQPQKADTASQTRNSGSGLAFNGVRLDGPAPVSAILENYTLAPFDDCGGHINLHVGYHYHAATDCLDDVASATDHGKVIGISMDGYFIQARMLADGSVPDDLDQCGGHTTEDQGYHYHAGAQGSNAILGCLTAQYGCVSEMPGAACDASAKRGGGGAGGAGGGGRPDFAAAARQLGVSEGELKSALGGPPPNFDKAANVLGVSVEQLREAMAQP